MKRLFILILFALLFFGFVSCGGSATNKSLKAIDEITTKAEKEKDKLTDEDWMKLGKEMETHLETLNKAIDDDELGMMDRLKCVGIVARWTKIAVEKGLEKVEKETGMSAEELGKELEKAASELEKATGEMND